MHGYIAIAVRSHVCFVASINVNATTRLSFSITLLHLSYGHPITKPNVGA